MIYIYYIVGIEVEDESSEEESQNIFTVVPLTAEFDFLVSICQGLEVSLWVESNPFHATHINFIWNTIPSVLCAFGVCESKQKKGSKWLIWSCD